MDKSIRTRRQWNFYVVLFAGLQFLFTLYYNYDIAKGLKTYEKEMGDKWYPPFKFGCYALFVCGVVFHCISKPLYRGTSGLPMQFVGFAACLVDLAAVICFFVPLIKFYKNDAFTWVQLFIYIPNLVTIIGLTYTSRKSIQPAQLTIPGSWLISRRRDWGICGTIFSGCQIVMIFWEFVKSCYDTKKKVVERLFKESANSYLASLGLMTLGALGYHIVALNISKGMCPCHRKMVISGIVFVTIEIIGFIIYEYVCTKYEYKHIFFYHTVIFALGVILSGIGNFIISWKKFDQDFAENNNYQNVDSIKSNI